MDQISLHQVIKFRTALCLAAKCFWTVFWGTWKRPVTDGEIEKGYMTYTIYFRPGSGWWKCRL